MEARIVEFAEILRQNGLRVSTAEVNDAARAASEVGLADRPLFKSALRATMCKREVDIEPFDKAFELVFTGAARTFEAIDASLLERLKEAGTLEGDELAMVIATVNRLFNQLSPLAQAALAGDRAKLAQIFRTATLQLDLSRMESPMQGGFFSRRLMAGAGGEKARTDLDALADELKARGVSPGGVEIVSRHLGEALRKVEDAARREVDRQAKARIRRAGGALADRAFHTLTREEVEKAESAVRKLAEKLKARLVRKARSKRRGSLNVRRTLRKNLTWGGVPMVPAFRTRRPERPEVVVLCDVSDSVRNASRMMLLFTYTLQSLFVRVRSFVFVSDVGEVTKYFKDAEVDEAIDLATAGKAISLHSNSNYGRAFASFARDQLGSISRRTTVMVIGDGRNNFNPANAWVLKDIKAKCKRLLWICSEDKRAWGFGDSEMPAYARHCHQVVTVQSLSDLEKVAGQLLPV
ncbi:MAG: VWA domain-containing protein [Myxococcaceae bacterium]